MIKENSNFGEFHNEDPCIEQPRRNFAKNFIEKKIKFYKKKEIQYNLLLEKSLSWEEEFHIAQLLQANLYKIAKGDSEVVVEDWKLETSKIIKINPLKKIATQIAEKFKKSQKLKKAVPHLEKLIRKNEEVIDSWKKIYEELATIKNDDLFIQFCFQKGIPFEKKNVKTVENKIVTKKLPYRSYKSSSGFVIWVGRSDEDNDIMTFSYANGSDLWMHVSGYPGSHVIVRFQKGKEFDEKTIQEACQLAIFYSKAKNFDAVEVVMTQQKFVKKVDKKCKGKVHIANTKKMNITRNLNILSEVKSR